MSLDEYISDEIKTLLKEELIPIVRQELSALNNAGNIPVEFIDKYEVADLLGVSVSTVDNLRRKGVIRGYRIGNGTKSPVRFVRNEVVADIKHFNQL